MSESGDYKTYTIQCTGVYRLTLQDSLGSDQYKDVKLNAGDTVQYYTGANAWCKVNGVEIMTCSISLSAWGEAHNQYGTWSNRFWLGGVECFCFDHHKDAPEGVYYYADGKEVITGEGAWLVWHYFYASGKSTRDWYAHQFAIWQSVEGDGNGGGLNWMINEYRKEDISASNRAGLVEEAQALIDQSHGKTATVMLWHPVSSNYQRLGTIYEGHSIVTAFELTQTYDFTLRFVYSNPSPTQSIKQNGTVKATDSWFDSVVHIAQPVYDVPTGVAMTGYTFNGWLMKPMNNIITEDTWIRYGDTWRWPTSVYNNRQ